MINAILNGLLNFIKSIISIILTPIDLLISGLFPNFSSQISTFNVVVTQYIGGGLNYFSSIIPPGTKTLIVIYLTFLLTLFGLSISIHAILRILKIVKNIKMW